MKMIPKKYVEQGTDETDDLLNLSHADKETVNRVLKGADGVAKTSIPRVLKGADGVAKTSIPLDAQPVSDNQILQTIIEHLNSERGTPKISINETETDFVLTLTWGK